MQTETQTQVLKKINLKVENFLFENFMCGENSAVYVQTWKLEILKNSSLCIHKPTFTCSAYLINTYNFWMK
jgi:hypothetical protein